MVRTRRRGKRGKSTRRRRPRQRIVMRGGMTEEAFRAELVSLFPEIDTRRIRIYDIVMDRATVTLTYCKESKTHYFSPTFIVNFKDKSMWVSLLAPCSPISGAEMLRRLIALATRLQLHTISLSDESDIYLHPSMHGRYECMLPLPYFRILMKGESWYQSYGFTSEKNAEDREHNERVRAMPLRDFVQAIVENEKSMAHDGGRFIGALLEAFPELTADTPVSDAIQHMVKTVNQLGAEMCDHPAFQLLKRLVEGSALPGADGRPLIHYDYKHRTLHLQAPSNAPNTSS